MRSPLRIFALTITAGVFGLVFGLGLVLSHMVDPARVAAFLDVAGAWDPTLGFVMGGAVLVASPAFALARRGGRALIGTHFELPDRFRITPRLVLGAVLFGIGWGLSGICPAPGIVLAGDLQTPGLVFVVAVIAGILLADLVGRVPRGGAPD